MTDNGTPWEAPLAGTEARHLAGALERLRASFRWNGDLDAVGLQARVGVSSPTLGGPARHRARAGEQMVSAKRSGAPWDAADWGGDATVGSNLGRGP